MKDKKSLESRVERIENILGYFFKFDSDFEANDLEKYTISERLSLLEKHVNLHYQWDQGDSIPSTEKNN